MTIYSAIAKRWGTSNLAIHGATVVAASLLLAISAKIAVPFYPVPITMQTFVVIGLGLALGPWRGLAAVLLYLAEGAAGFPVFAGTPEKGIGLAYMMGPTGGYLLGYLPAVLLAGWLAVRGWDRNPLYAMAAALFAGAVIYVPGLLWLGAVLGFDKPILQFGLYPFIFGDIAKALLAALVFPTTWKWISARTGH
ncbi:biotin transporter BioY [Mesorhizobium tianshanense]|uniref:Biotin transporter n=1 Tax=Mesorhizobium tianshanense TaxID=39844 RepID=A0A562NBU5_9HYPH|nr:biotin transporter BioY [Mesorhizobium tianshanense]TWI29538.1 biotin transport system substrate-specific component [Mesorhizobium tianshanense]GLS34926.1 biotin transporter BioY [Mesorhizobium tianshanense]